MSLASQPELLALQQAVVGRYFIERELGRGGMGIVFLARDVALERPVAIKLLPPVLAGDDRMRDRFVREARTAARLSHPNIVPIHSVEKHDEVVFFVMSFVEGETLTARVRRAGPLDARDGSRLVQELAWALAYAHSAGVIHRDVKPDNVMIDRATGRAMLTDFGIARVADSGPSAATGEIVGTAQFLSPEQASGAAVDGRSDLYSLGVTAFFALTGRLPFESPTVAGYLGLHLTQAPPAIATVRPSLPSQLSVAIDRCLAKNPADRFDSGEALAEAIAASRGGEVQVAPAVRAFLRDRTRTMNELALLFFAAQYLGGFSHLPFGKIALPLTVLAVASVARLVRTGRRLARAGYTFGDVRVALEADHDAQAEELEIALTPAGEAQTRKWALARSAGVVALLMGGGAVLAGLSRQRIVPLALGAAAMVVGGLLVRWAGPTPPREQRQRLLGRWLDQLWQGRLGQWFFALVTPSNESLPSRLRRWLGLAAGTASTAVPAPQATIFAPTEVLLARSAEELLEALPPELRERLDAGRTIARLRVHVATLREREEQLAAAVARAGQPMAATPASSTSEADEAMIERHGELVRDLHHARRDAAARRASAVAALENIRLQLLRLRAGLGSPTDLTTDLAAAEDIERQIEAFIDANDLTV